MYSNTRDRCTVIHVIDVLLIRAQEQQRILNVPRSHMSSL